MKQEAYLTKPAGFTISNSRTKNGMVNTKTQESHSHAVALRFQCGRNRIGIISGLMERGRH
nr:MAG TPA: hypothetical protein [Caudoviricetes sp.]